MTLRQSILVGLCLAVATVARGAEPAATAPDAGVVPLAPLAGDWWTRPVFTGDWGGARADLAGKGVQFDLGWTQYVQSVVQGGHDVGTRYGGNLDLTVHLDLMRMGVMPGAFVKLKAESRYGQGANDIAGSLLPVNTAAFFPLGAETDETIPLVVTNLTYYQFLSKQFGLFAGKFDTLDADPNEFAGGRGARQFMNANFVFNPVAALATPYSALGGGVIVIPNEHVTISSLLYTTTDSSRSSGFETLDDGWSWSTEIDFQYRLGELPGGVNVGGTYAWDNDFARLGQRFVFRGGEGVAVPEKSDTWFVFLSGWQYLSAQGVGAAGAARTTDGRPDYKGFGLFYRIGVADSSTNPVSWSVSGGLGGRGLIPGRDQDVWGVGYVYTSIQDERLFAATGIRDYAHGGEAFYNIALTGWARFTLDLQVIDDILPGTDTTVVVGGRLEMRF